jgi:coenzyme F420-reducing hydrogenase delta subunit
MATAVRQAAVDVTETSGEAGWEPKVIAFLCSWCSYASADLAGAARIQYPTNVRIVRVPCAGRVNPLFIIKSLQRGADGVLVVGCHPGKCHYVTGNLFARRRFGLLKSLLEHVGVEEGRVQFAWAWASEGKKFAQLVTDMVETVEALGPAQALVRRDPYAKEVQAQSRGSLLREQGERSEA